jgi:hypothetical protein
VSWPGNACTSFAGMPQIGDPGGQKRRRADFDHSIFSFEFFSKDSYVATVTLKQNFYSKMKNIFIIQVHHCCL